MTVIAGPDCGRHPWANRPLQRECIFLLTKAFGVRSFIMALIPCPEPGCGKSVSSMATTCPHCGAPISSSAAAAGPIADKRELRVASDGSGDVASIQEAVRRVPDGGLIRVAAGGVYNETISLTRPVTIVGESGGTQPVIQSVGQRLLTVDGATVMLRGLTLHCVNPKSTVEKGPPEDSAGVWCKSGHISAESCKFVCDQGTSLLVDGPSGNAKLANCQVEGSSGIVVNAGATVSVSSTQVKTEYDPLRVFGGASLSFVDGEVRGSSIISKGRFEAKNIVAELQYGMAFHETADATITGGTGNTDIRVYGTCHFKMQNATWNCRKHGLSVGEQAQVEIEACKIEGQVSCRDGATLHLSSSRVQVPQAERSGSALSLSGEGQTRVLDCELLGNQSSSGVDGSDSHNVRIERCRISGHKKAVSISDHVRATAENCDLRGNSTTFDTEPTCRLHQSGNRQ
jgi:hypothetical protein